MIDVLDTIGSWLFKGWESMARVIVVGILAYSGLLLFLRVSGKRTLSKMNAFDLVVTVALGSTLSTIIVSRQTGVADGLIALALLISLQYAVAWLSVRWPWFRKGIKSEPALLFHRGTYLYGAMRRERVTTDEILAAIRQSGNAVPAGVSAVVLETDGSFTVLSDSPLSDMPSLQNVTRPPTSEPSQK